MNEGYIKYKLVNKNSKEEMKLDEIYYEPDTTALQIKMAILNNYQVTGVNPEVIKLRSISYKNNTQDIGPNVELSTIFTDTDSDKNEIIFDFNEKFQNTRDTFVAPHSVTETNKLQITINNSTFDYVGDIKDRMPNGKGKIVYTSGKNKGIVYEGEVKDGIPDGYGKIIYPIDQHPRIESYQGIFSKGHPTTMIVDSLDNSDQIRALIVYRNGDQYEGGANAYLQPTGMGIMMKQNGDVYVGKFRFGVYNDDMGKMTYADGTVFEGRMMDGKKVTNIVQPKWDESTVFGKNFQIVDFSSPPSSPERKKPQLLEPPLVVRKKKKKDEEEGGGLFTRKYKKQLKRKTRRYVKKRRVTIRNKKQKKGHKSRKHK